MGELVSLEAGRKVGNWIIERRLGAGCFGSIYRCKGVKKKGVFAFKVEGANEEIQLLKMELVVLNELKKNKTKHFCRVEDKGHEHDFIYLVMTLVGRSLQDLRLAAPGKKFSSGTAISVGIQCLEALQELHGIGYLHRDIKPANYAIGRAELKELRKIYLLDFGMCRKYIKADGTIHAPRTAAGFRGTIKYAPVACHLEKDLCRSDDCESWLYVLIEITTGSLPWRNIQDLNEVGRCKQFVRTNDLEMKQLFGGCPREYIDAMKIIDGLQYFEEPKYREIFKLLRRAIRTMNVPEYPYDWEEEEEKREKEAKQGGEVEKQQEKERKERKKKEDRGEDGQSKKAGSRKAESKKSESKKLESKKSESRKAGICAH